MTAKIRLSVGAVLVALTSGCATITGAETQAIMVSSRDRSGAAVADAQCTLESPRGKWSLVTPASVTVVRSSDDIQVECRKEGLAPGLAKLISRAHGGMFGNIIFGGGIGAIIDHSKGTGYEYPNVATIVMGETTMIDRREEVTAVQGGSNTPRPAGEKLR
jgi:hypothetical protein